MDIRESFVNGSPLLILSGPLAFPSAPVVLNALIKQDQIHWQRLLIDVECVTFVDRSGLGVLALAAKRVQRMNREMVIVNPRGQLRNLLEETNFSAFAPVMDLDLEYSTFTNIG